MDVADETWAHPALLKLTQLLPAVVENPLPVIVTELPTAPLTGLNPVTIGNGTVKVPVEQPCCPSLTLTHTAPVDAPDITCTTN